MKATWTWDKIKTKKGCYSFWEGDKCIKFWVVDYLCNQFETSQVGCNKFRPKP